jgi:hypothetical protein
MRCEKEMNTSNNDCQNVSTPGCIASHASQPEWMFEDTVLFHFSELLRCIRMTFRSRIRSQHCSCTKKNIASYVPAPRVPPAPVPCRRPRSRRPGPGPGHLAAAAGPCAGPQPWPDSAQPCLLHSLAEESQEISVTARTLLPRCIISIQEMAWPLPSLVTTVLQTLLVSLGPAEVPDVTTASATTRIYPPPGRVLR